MKRSRLRTVAVANLKVGRGRAAIRGLRSLIRDADADAVLLQEAKNYVPAIRVAFPGWRVYGGAGFRESSNCAVMVRRSIRRGKRGVVRNRRVWYYRGKGRQQVAHEGRVWRWVRADGVALMSVHKATEALGYNERAGAEEADSLIEWFADHADPLIAAGDWNNLASDKRQNGPADIARLAKAQVVVPAGGRIDYALVRGVDVTATEGETYGSDHRSFRLRLRRP